MENTELIITRKNLWEVRFWYSITSYLIDNEYKNVVQILPHDTNDLIKTVDDVEYILKEKIECNKIRIDKKKTFYKLLEHLALFHKILKGFTPLPGSKIKLDWGKWKSNINVYSNRLTTCLEENKIADIDFEAISNGLALCQTEISKIDYEALIKYAMDEKQIILNERPKRAFIIWDENYYIKIIEKCIYDLKSKDLAALIFDYISDSNLKSINLEDIVNKYKSFNEFNEFEEFMLRIYLLMPSRCINQLRKYIKTNTKKDLDILKRYVKEYTKVFNIVKEAVWVQNT